MEVGGLAVETGLGPQKKKRLLKNSKTLISDPEV